MGKRRLGGGWGCSVSPGTCCWGCEHCLFAANLSLPFMLLCVFCFFFLFPLFLLKVLVTTTGAMKVNTLQFSCFPPPPSARWARASRG